MEGVSWSPTLVSVRHRYDTDTCDYIELCHCLKILSV